MADISSITTPNGTKFTIKDALAVKQVAYDSSNKKITKTINGTTTDVVTVATLKSAMGIANLASLEYEEVT